MANQTIFQAFHWYYPADGSLWKQLAKEAKGLKESGVTMVWLPPAYKDHEGGDGRGYAVYDLYDLGEFDQHGSVRTKYGTKDEYVQCVNELKKQGLGVMVDVVLNHRLGGDEPEVVKVQDFNDDNRTEKKGEPFDLEVISRFTFPGRKGKYSKFIWDHQCFTGINDKGDHGGRCRFYNIHNEYGDNWDNVPSAGFGNFDYLIGADVEFRNPAVQQELKDWGSWFYETAPFQGVRLDALKHMNADYIKSWVAHMKSQNKDLLVIGEYWSQSLENLSNYVNYTEGQIQLFDVPLHYNFAKAATADSSYDLRTLWDATLTQHNPLCSITFVDNHDTQPMQSLESLVDYWFQALAHAIILLREQGIPCIFHASYFGAKYGDNNSEGEYHEVELNETPGLRKMMAIRKDLAYGLQRDYLDHPNVIGWTREGDDEHQGSGCAVLLSNGHEGSKYMEVGKRHSGQKFIDALGYRQEEVEINGDGWGEFFVHERSVSVWIPKA